MATTNGIFCFWKFILRLSFLVLLVSTAHSSLAAEIELSEVPSELDEKTVQLSREEILQAFSDVRDDAEVQDDDGSIAVNYWYADGKFISAWSNAAASGEVIGKWRVKDNLRCITITKGLAKREGVESCNPVFRRGDKFLSFNSDGSVHGIHTLTPLSSVLTPHSQAPEKPVIDPN